MAKQRIEWLDSLRGLAIIFVIVGHAWALPSWGKAIIYAFHMPLFFAISGCVFRVTKYQNVGQCIVDKARTLLLPYLLLYAINIPLQFVSMGLLAGKYYDAESLFLGFLSGSVWGVSSCHPLWFLPCLFMVSILFWCLAKVELEFKVPLWLLMLVVFGVGVAVYEFIPGQGFLHWKTVFMATTFYYFGYVFMKHRDKVFKFIGYDPSFEKPQFKPYFYILALALLLIGYFVGLQNGKISMMSNIYHNYGFTLVSACCTSLGLAMVMMRAPKLSMLDYTGKNSLGFFGLHRNLLYAIENWSLTFPLLGSNPLVATLVVWLLLFPCCELVNRILPESVGKRRPKKARPAV